MLDVTSEDQQVALDTTADVVAALVANHRSFLAFLQRRLGSPELAEDVLQEAFSRGLDKLDTLRDQESAVAWFYRVLRNAVIDQHRRRAAAHNTLQAFAHEVETHAEPEPELGSAICQCVATLAGTLRSDYATILKRVEVDGIALKDFAAEAGISSNNAAVRIFRARSALRKQVALSCGTCADHGCLNCTCEASVGRCAGHAYTG